MQKQKITSVRRLKRCMKLFNCRVQDPRAIYLIMYFALISAVTQSCNEMDIQCISGEPLCQIWNAPVFRTGASKGFSGLLTVPGQEVTPQNPQKA